MSTTEEWRSVPNTDLLASSEGRLMVQRWQHANGHWYGGVPTAGQWDGKRYIYCRRGYKTRKVARLVCEAFNGPAGEGEVVMHMDESSRNNRPTNLAWGTQQRNLNFPGFLAKRSILSKGQHAISSTA